MAKWFRDFCQFLVYVQIAIKYMCFECWDKYHGKIKAFAKSRKKCQDCLQSCIIFHSAVAAPGAPFIGK